MIEWANIDYRRTGIENLIIRISQGEDDKIPFVRVRIKSDLILGYADYAIVYDQHSRKIGGTLDLPAYYEDQVKSWIDKNYSLLICIWSSSDRIIFIQDLLDFIQKI